MLLNEYGKIVADCWREIPIHYPCVEIDAFIVMPNHIHGIIIIHDRDCHSARNANHECDRHLARNVGATHCVAPTIALQHPENDAREPHTTLATHCVAPTIAVPHPENDAREPRTTITPNSIGSIIGQFKSIVTKQINQFRGTPGAPIWQRNYWACPERPVPAPLCGAGEAKETHRPQR
jgi:hypothetical protein